MSVCVLGSINLDVVCRVAELPAPGETVMALSLDRFAGGKGANQAVASARWGAPTSMIGAVGQDEAGESLLAHLAAAGVDTSGVVRIAGAPTGQAQIFVSQAGENMIVVVGGANRSLGAEQIAAARFDGGVLLAQLETPVGAIAAFFSAPSAGIRILNAAPALEEGTSLFALADVLVVNETELARYAGASAPDAAEEIAQAARCLLRRAGQSVIVTLGAAGSMAVDADRVVSAPGRPARVVDATGAGDCFCGVLAAALADGAGLAEAMACANLAASHSTECAGASPPADLRARVEAR